MGRWGEGSHRPLSEESFAGVGCAGYHPRRRLSRHHPLTRIAPMDRRHFVKAGLAAGALAPADLPAAVATAAADERHLYELRIYEMRGDIASARIRPFFSDHLIPALKRAGAGPIGVFTPEAGFTAQSMLMVIDYGSFTDMGSVMEQLHADSAYVDAARAFDQGADLPYVRYESRLMRAFAAHPRTEVPPSAPGRPPRLFELRTYESRSASTLERKIAMFNEGEIEIFRSIHMLPVFFGENIFGTRLPSLTYMMAVDDMAARMKGWDAFRTHPDWQKMSKDARYDVKGAVTVSHVALLNPTPFSQIR
ncbi:MAG: NIPSNAP family protein [Gemmatimonadaceae bacterium]